MNDSYSLNSKFDISESFREKIRNQKNKKYNNIDKNKINKIENQKYKIDWIVYVSEGIYNLYINYDIIPLNSDELIKIIRFSPHLYYCKKNNLFFNINYIRMFFYEINNDQLCLFTYVNKSTEILKIRLDWDDISSFFEYISHIEGISIKEYDFELITVKIFNSSFSKYVKRKMFEKEFKNLYRNYQFSLISVVSAMLLYFIPFIPFIGISKFSISTLPITTILVISLLFSHFETKNKIKNLK